METIKKLFYIAIWVLILSWLFGFGWAITITIVLSVLSKIFKSPARPAKERKTKVPLAAKTAASAYIGYKAGKKIGKW